ncbi:MAG: Adenosylcobinamide-GDP ribazoletransferase [Nocardioides sp.]|nr:Adenosylcobinamide-GDP ribazoletransferase [Nocardioides sp.]
MPDAWRLAVGTLTVLRVPAPRAVDRRTAGAAMLLAPLAVLPLGGAVVLVLSAGRAMSLPSLVTGLLAVALLVLGTRALHVDGLSDTVDGLTASYDPERSLAAMRTGTSGPAGGVAVFLVLALQATALGWLAAVPRGAVLAGALVCVSRCALVLTCARGVPPARSGGLGETYTESVRTLTAVLSWVLALVVTALLVEWAGMPWWRGLLAVLLALVVTFLLVRRAVARLGGVTGDVFGAGVELCLATLLVALAGATQ